MNLQRHILTVLARQERLLPVSTLIAEVNMERATDALPSEFRAETAELESKGQIVSARHEDKGVTYKITAEGKARLAS